MKKHSLESLAIAFLIPVFCSCASQRMCNKESAYEQGMNDARFGKQMNSSYIDSCVPEYQSVIRSGYQDGYTAGVCSPSAPPIRGK